MSGHPDPTMPKRRFPPPWPVEDNDNYFIAKDGMASGKGWRIFTTRRNPVAKLLAKDEARRIAANFAKLPDLFRK